MALMIGDRLKRLNSLKIITHYRCKHNNRYDSEDYVSQYVDRRRAFEHRHFERTEIPQQEWNFYCLPVLNLIYSSLL